jgi:hypothetical protein
MTAIIDALVEYDSAHSVPQVPPYFFPSLCKDIRQLIWNRLPHSSRTLYNMAHRPTTKLTLLDLVCAVTTQTHVVLTREQLLQDRTCGMIIRYLGREYAQPCSKCILDNAFTAEDAAYCILTARTEKFNSKLPYNIISGFMAYRSSLAILPSDREYYMVQVAAYLGRIDIFKQIMETNSFGIDFINTFLIEILNCAAAGNRIEIFEFMGDTSGLPTQFQINPILQYGSAKLLQWIISIGHPFDMLNLEAVARSRVETLAKIKLLNSVMPFTPMHIKLINGAITPDQLDVIEYLYESGALDVEQLTTQVVAGGHVECAKWMISKGIFTPYQLEISDDWIRALIECGRTWPLKN